MQKESELDFLNLAAENRFSLIFYGHLLLICNMRPAYCHDQHCQNVLYRDREKDGTFVIIFYSTHIISYLSVHIQQTQPE